MKQPSDGWNQCVGEGMPAYPKKLIWIISQIASLHRFLQHCELVHRLRLSKRLFLPVSFESILVWNSIARFRRYHLNQQAIFDWKLISHEALSVNSRMQMSDASLPTERAYLSPKEVVALVGCSMDSVLRWINEGELKASNIGSGSRRRWIVKLTDLEAFLDSRSNQPKTTPVRRAKKKIKRYVWAKVINQTTGRMILRIIDIVEWCGREIRSDKRGSISSNLAPILGRLGLDGQTLIGAVLKSGVSADWSACWHVS